MSCNNIEHKISSFGTMDKRGVTLIEVLVVVIIMGVLAGLGVANLQQAVRNARIKDAAINVTAFLERIANDANRLNTSLCISVDKTGGHGHYKTIKVYKSDAGKCSSAKDVFSELTLDSENNFVEAPENRAGCETNFYNNGATYAPRLGLSAASTGCFYVRYGETDHYAVINKSATRNSLTYMLSYDSGVSWMKP